MTPKEKAKELLNKFYNAVDDCAESVYESCADKAQKVCALIAIDEILKLPSLDDGRMISITEFDYNYWQEVKKELEAMK